MMSWWNRLVGASVVGILAVGSTTGVAYGSLLSQPRTVQVTITATGRDGGPGLVGYQADAVPLTPSFKAEYRSNADGVLSVPRGKYLITMSITSNGPAGEPDSQTLGATEVTVKRKMTIHFDARQGKAVTGVLTGASATQRVASVGVCPRLPGLTAFGVSASGSGSTPELFAIPTSNPDFTLSYASKWADASGNFYVITGLHAHGIPANARFSARSVDLASLTVTNTGSSPQQWHVTQASNCGVGAFWPTEDLAPGASSTLLLSAGQWVLLHAPLQVDLNLKPRHRYHKAI
jgi:hypothetical protein